MNDDKDTAQVIGLRTYAEDLNRVRAQKNINVPTSKKETASVPPRPPQTLKTKYVPPQKPIPEEKEGEKNIEKKIPILSKPYFVSKEESETKKPQEKVENIPLENPPFHSIRATGPAETSLTKSRIGKKTDSTTEKKHQVHREPKPKFQIKIDKSLTGYKESILSDKEHVFEIYAVDGVPEEGTIIKDTKHKRFKLFPAIMASLSKWFSEKKIDIHEARKPKYTVTPAHARKEIIVDAAKQSKRMPRDDHKIVKERLKLLPRIAVHEGMNIKKASDVPKTAWKHFEEKDNVSLDDEISALSNLKDTGSIQNIQKKQASEYKIKSMGISEKSQPESFINISPPPETPSTETDAVLDELEDAFIRDEYHTLQKNIVKRIDTRDEKEKLYIEDTVVEKPASGAKAVESSPPSGDTTPNKPDTSKEMYRETKKVGAGVQTFNNSLLEKKIESSEEIPKKSEAKFAVEETDRVQEKTLLEIQVSKETAPKSEMLKEVPKSEENLPAQAREVDNTVPPDEQLKEEISEKPQKELSGFADVDTEEEAGGYAAFREEHPLEEEIFKPSTVKQEKSVYRDKPPTKPQAPYFNRQPVPQERLAARSVLKPEPMRFSFNILVVGIIAVVLVFVVGFALWWFLGNQTGESLQTRSIPRLIDAKVQIPIPLENSREAFLDFIAEKSKISAGVSQFYPVISNEVGIEEPADTTDIVALLDLRAPGSFQRSIIDITFGVLDDTSPFIIIKASSFDEAFSGMLTWEKNISADLSPFFGSVVTRSFDKDARTVDRTREPFFRDVSISNRDARVLVDELGDERIVYVFNDKNTILITTSTKALAKLITLIR